MAVNDSLGNARRPGAVKNVVLLVERHLDIRRANIKGVGPRRMIMKLLAGRLQRKSQIRSDRGDVHEVLKRCIAVLI